MKVPDPEELAGAVLSDCAGDKDLAIGTLACMVIEARKAASPGFARYWPQVVEKGGR